MTRRWFEPDVGGKVGDMNRHQDAQTLREALDYNPGTGEFRWKSTLGRRVKVGALTGTISSNGYVRLSVNRRSHYAHRVAWLLVHGDWPKHTIDHINGNKADNRLSNLRDVTQSQNLRNQHKARSISTTGLLGVSKRPSGRTWQARISMGGKQVSLGFFPTPEQAHQAYLAARASVASSPS